MRRRHGLWYKSLYLHLLQLNCISNNSKIVDNFHKLNFLYHNFRNYISIRYYLLIIYLNCQDRKNIHRTNVLNIVYTYNYIIELLVFGHYHKNHHHINNHFHLNFYYYWNHNCHSYFISYLFYLMLSLWEYSYQHKYNNKYQMTKVLRLNLHQELQFC